jgi:hypothetical protein
LLPECGFRIFIPPGHRIMPDQQSQWVSLSSGDLAATINPLGAQLSTLRDRTGLDLLWDESNQIRGV